MSFIFAQGSDKKNSLIAGDQNGNERVSLSGRSRVYSSILLDNLYIGHYVFKKCKTEIIENGQPKIGGALLSNFVIKLDQKNKVCELYVPRTLFQGQSQNIDPPANQFGDDEEVERSDKK